MEAETNSRKRKKECLFFVSPRSGALGGNSPTSLYLMITVVCLENSFFYSVNSFFIPILQPFFSKCICMPVLPLYFHHKCHKIYHKIVKYYFPKLIGMTFPIHFLYFIHMYTHTLFKRIMKVTKYISNIHQI